MQRGAVVSPESMVDSFASLGETICGRIDHLSRLNRVVRLEDMAACADDNDEHTLRIEAHEVVKEVAYAVNFVEISQVLPISDNLVYLNLRTKENDTYCVELSVQGFRVVARKFNIADTDSTSRHFETIYSLLDSLSPGYRNSFSETLMAKLQTLQPVLHDEESMDTK